MADDNLFIRSVPEHVRSWIDIQRRERMVSLREVVVEALEKASKSEPQPSLFDSMKPIRLTHIESTPFKFIDLFAGIGGLRIGFERAGGTCVFSSEWDKYSQRTYAHWFGETPHGDIQKIRTKDIPDHDVLIAGFPCQPFSLAGVSKKNSLGQAHGFKCETQGTLFFNVASIVETKRPPVVLLENVKNLRSHDKGRTWQVIRSTLTEDLGYTVFEKIIDAADYVPQHRERVFIVCFDRRQFGDAPQFQFPDPPPGPRPKLRDILDSNPDPRFTLTDHLWKYLQSYAKRQAEKGNGFGFGLADLDGITRTLSARYYKDGSEILIPQIGKNPRRLTPDEAKRLMGFPESLKVVVSDTQAYRQFGNAVVPLVSEAVARQVVKTLCWQLERERDNGCLLKKSKPSKLKLGAVARRRATVSR